MKSYIEDLGKRLSELRCEKDLSCNQVANMLGSYHDVFYRYEAGEVNPSSSTLIKIAKFYKVSTDYILGLSDNKVNVSSNYIDEFAKLFYSVSDNQKQAVIGLLKAFNNC